MAYKMTFNGRQLSLAAFIVLASIVFVGAASAATLTVDDSGGADYTSIQTAINAATAGDTILVYSGTYAEQVAVNKQLILIGVDNGGGKPAVNTGQTGSAITLSADSTTLDGFVVTNGWTIGIKITSSNNEVKNNTIQGISGTTDGNPGYGIYMDTSYNNFFINNTVNNIAGGKNRLHSGYGGNGYGIYIGSYNNNNTFINNSFNNNIGGFGNRGGNGYGIYIDSSNNNNFINNSVNNNVGGQNQNLAWGGNGYGIYIGNSNNNTFINNSVNNNIGGPGGSGYGIYIDSSNDNLIYNNYFNNINNAATNGYVNIWNTTKSVGTTIVGGHYLGGNFWASPSGTGYSQTCTDANWDGICDSSYTLDGSNIDYLSLSMNFNLDEASPTTTIELYGTFSSNGWYTSDVQVNLTASDNEGGSGVAKTEYSFDGTNWNTYIVPFTITDEGTTTVYFKSTDNVGNVEPIMNQTVKIDKTPPTITGAPTTSPNTNGWYNTDVAVHFTASDIISGIDTVTPDTTISTEGVNQSVTGTAIDKAGNSASTTVSGINIDKTPPQIAINTPANSGVYIFNQILIADWSATDSLSGIASAAGTLPSGAPIDTGIVGAKTFTVNAADIASNTATQTASYTINYDFLGILPPVRTDNSSIFKLGSTVPVKFRIADANGNYVSIAVANLAYQKITDNILGTVEEAISTSAASEGNAFRYDSTDNLYIFNLGTTGMDIGTYQLNINLDDGTVKTVRISLK